MRLTVVGGGGFRVPLIYRALLQEPDAPIDEITLYDVDEARLEVIGAVLGQMAAESADGGPRVTRTTDLDRGLRGADFVFVAMRVGGLAGRVADERAARAEGLLAQETTGAGGVLYGLRTVPVAVRLAHHIADVAPSAWTINFTNPVGMITAAMFDTLGGRVIGICDSPRALCRRVARALRLDPERPRYDYVGLNHLGWLRALLVDGRDLLPDLLADDTLISSFEEGRLFGADRLRSLGAIPNEYLWYWYFPRDAESLSHGRQSRGDYLLEQQGRFYGAVQAHPADALRLWGAALADRDSTYLAAERAAAGAGERDATHEGYERVALAVMKAIAHDERTVLIVNVRNRSAIPGLPEEAIVEVPCLVDGGGAHPIAAGPVEGHMLELMRVVQSVEATTIRAAVTGSAELAVRALAMHPLVGSAPAAGRLVAATGLTTP